MKALLAPNASGEAVMRVRMPRPPPPPLHILLQFLHDIENLVAMLLHQLKHDPTVLSAMDCERRAATLAFESSIETVAMMPAELTIVSLVEALLELIIVLRATVRDEYDFTSRWIPRERCQAQDCITATRDVNPAVVGVVIIVVSIIIIIMITTILAHAIGSWRRVLAVTIFLCIRMAVLVRTLRRSRPWSCRT